ncbi:Uncharacterized protein PEXP_027060 [Penicillium expansum]|nr:hypothetical protein N7453_008202 [Penicillium expansum]KGO42957.1 Uncharacterized protein PEXP_027060 [Penicillium expansum]
MLETYPQSEDSDCEFGVFDDENESPVDDQEADFMSQYSFTPESSHPEQGLDPSCTESSSDVALDAHTFEDQFESQMNSTITADEGVHHLHRSDVPALSLSGGPNVHFQSDNLDYCLIEVGENDHYSSNLPVLSQANIGQLENRDVRVTASTGSGNVLNGILSGRPSCIRLPSATRFIDVLSVQLEDSLQPGDSGSIIRDANTGKIYGHIIAGDTESQNALIVPARDVLADVIAISRRIEMVSSPFDLLSPKRSSGVHTPVPGPKWRKSIKHPSAANHYSGHPHPVYHESMRAMQTYSGDPPRPQYTLGFSMWISAPQQAGQIDEVLHAYTRLQGDQNHRGIPLEYLSNWRSSFPAIATIVDDINNPIDCDIILLEVNLDLMTDFPPAGSRLGIQLDIDYGHPSAGDVLGVGQMDNWTCRTHIYQDGQSLINSHHQLTKTQSTKVKSLFELSWWAKIFTQLTQEKRTAEDSGLSQAAQDADDYIRHFFHSLSAVQELRASSPNLQRLSNQYQGHGDDRKRMALLAWTFRQTRPGEVGTTTWRRLLPARDRITANSP